MRVAAVISDLMFYSRIESAAMAADADIMRVDSPGRAPAEVDLVLVDWSARTPEWTDALRALRSAGVRVILFGPHTDLDAHAAARAAGLGPMMARSKLATSLSELFWRSARRRHPG